MATEIHAHKVLDLLREAPMSKAELKEKIQQTYGSEARFRTCKLAGFDVDSLLLFFEAKQKIIEDSGLWMLNEGRICSHSH
ncbi:YecH family metal-binding protein [Vibrio mangrovi]|uniref:YecH family protein n=1 Tax=Vibrio mangrovi TaxID=474394 RepID=A0A1Y6J0R4_9VIBR|nr:YecH family metal-binding protein [Vibrio mangrovi]MDW6002596.1 YecH family protein [Vibrio mangrovi]SMS01873.1 hypothetical protein VIM7927_03182 [Vibrio mangrovi]